MTAALLLALLGFMCWAIRHVHARARWHDDDRLAEEFLELLRGDS